MTVLVVMVLLTVLASGALAPFARWAVTAMSPARAVRLMTVASLASALSTGAALTALALGYLVGWAPVAARGHLSVTVFRRVAGVPGWVGLPAAGVVGVLLTAALVRVVVIGGALFRAERLCRSLPGATDAVFVDEPDIVALAGWRGRILLGRPLYERISGADRAVVTAHERSHLRHRHHLYLHAVGVAVTANPLLRGVRPVVGLGIERWADEDAAAAVGDRAGAAHALARVALVRQELRTTAGHVPAGPVLAAAAGDVRLRVAALLEPATPNRRSWLLVPLVLSTLVLLLAGVGLAHVHDLIEAAQAALSSR